MENQPANRKPRRQSERRGQQAKASVVENGWHAGSIVRVSSLWFRDLHRVEAATAAGGKIGDRALGAIARSRNTRGEFRSDQVGLSWIYSDHSMKPAKGFRFAHAYISCGNIAQFAAFSCCFTARLGTAFAGGPDTPDAEWRYDLLSIVACEFEVRPQ